MLSKWFQLERNAFDSSKIFWAHSSHHAFLTEIPATNLCIWKGPVNLKADSLLNDAFKYELNKLRICIFPTTFDEKAKHVASSFFY